jgi:protein-tyrosine kinase
MTKIYEALEQAAQDQGGGTPTSTVPTSGSSSVGSKSVGMEEEMLGLYQNVSSLLGNGTGKTVQFISARDGEGAPQVAREFVRAVVQKLNKTGLLLDTNPGGLQAKALGVTLSTGWEDIINTDKSIREALFQIGNSGLFVSQASGRGTVSSAFFDSPRVATLLEELKDEFDVIAVDAPSSTVSADGLALSAKVDGVVIVVEAEETRWQVVQSIKERITKRGGKVLGVVLNKRRHYIPHWIYKRL